MKSPTFTWAGKDHSLLTETTAMACWSWSLPAGFACPGRQARSADDICYGCYAQIGAYTYNVVMEAQAARWAWTRKCMRSKEGRRVWIETMTAAIERCAVNGYFRWHDSGDVFNRTYCDCVREVCRRTPRVKHWIPTRSWRLSWGPEALASLHRLRNVVVRPSALQFGDAPPRVKGLGKGSTAHHRGELPRGAHECPKASEENASKSCEQADCRMCWENGCGASYLVHGRRGTKYVHHATSKERANVKAMVELKLSYSE
jgi:hypothetical protein